MQSNADIVAQNTFSVIFTSNRFAIQYIGKFSKMFELVKIFEVTNMVCVICKNLIKK